MLMPLAFTQLANTGAFRLIPGGACPPYVGALKSDTGVTYQLLTRGASRTIRLNGIDFIIDNSVERVELSHLSEAAQTIASLNRLLPEGERVRTVRINGSNGRTHYIGTVKRPGDETTSSAIAFLYEGKPINPRSIYHEIGHAIYTAYNLGQNPVWFRIWQEAHQTDVNRVPAWKVVDDSEYEIGAPDYLGHPQDHMGELFASSFQAVALNGPTFEKLLQQYSSHEGFGRQIQRFMEDQGFVGRAALPRNGRGALASR